jgi:YVTN family beta-propeller protein
LDPHNESRSNSMNLIFAATSSRQLMRGNHGLTLAGCRTHDIPQYPANYREYVYVTNGDSGTVSVIDVVNLRLDRELRVGQNPIAVAASPTSNEVYVVNSGSAGGSGSLSVINAANNSLAATIPLHVHPVSIEVDAAGKLAYIANSGSNSVSVIDLKSRREVAQMGVGEEPVAVRLTPDGKTLVVSNRRGNSVSLFGAASMNMRAVFSGCPGAGEPVFLPDSSKVFVPCTSGHQVMAISLARTNQSVSPQAVAAQSVVAQPDRLEALMDVGRSPVDLALKPDGGEVFAINSGSDSISEVETGTNDVLGATMMGDTPVNGHVSTDNTLLYVANQRSQNVIAYAINDGRRAGWVRVGDGPSAMTFSAAGHLLFVVDTRSGDVALVRTAKIDAENKALFTLISVGRGPNAIVDKAFSL